MKSKILNNSNMHFEHAQWKLELAFWEDELNSFNNRLNELVFRWTNKDVLAQLRVASGKTHIKYCFKILFSDLLK